MGGKWCLCDVLALNFSTGTMQGRNSVDKNKPWDMRATMDVKALLWTYEVAGAA